MFFNSATKFALDLEGCSASNPTTSFVITGKQLKRRNSILNLPCMLCMIINYRNIFSYFLRKTNYWIRSALFSPLLLIALTTCYPVTFFAVNQLKTIHRPGSLPHCCLVPSFTQLTQKVGDGD